MMMMIIDLVKEMQRSEPSTKNVLVKMFCDICCSDNIETQAVAFCVKCIEYLCENCYWYHSKCKVTKEHKVITENIPVDVSVFESMRKLISCSEHPKLKITHFCHEHRMNLCLSCIAEAHRNCYLVQNLLELVPMIRDKEEEILTHMDMHQQLLSTHIAHCTTNIEKITMAKEDILHSVADQADSLVEAVLNMRTKAEAEIQHVADQVTKSLQDDIDVCERVEKEAVDDEELVKFLAKHNDSDDSRTVLQIIWSNIRVHKDILSCLKTKPQHLHFVRNDIEFNLDTLGNAKVYFADEQCCNSDAFIPMLHQSNEIPCVNGSSFLKGCSSTSFASTSTIHVDAVASDVGFQSPKVKVCKSEHIPDEKPDGLKNSHHSLNYPYYSHVDDFKAPLYSLGPSNVFIPPLPCPDKVRMQLRSITPRQSHYRRVTCTESVDVHYVKITDDLSECSISKCVALESGSVCLIDLSNQRLKKINHTFKKCLCVKLEGIVSDICNPKDEEVAIVYNEQHMLSVIDLREDRMSAVRNILLPIHQKYKCITVDKQLERYILLYEANVGDAGTNTFIQIRSYSGKILNNLALDYVIRTKIEVPLVSVKCFISYTSKGLVLVGEGIGVRRIVLDFVKPDGRKYLVQKDCKILYSNNEGLEGLTSMACDLKGNVYTCSTNADGSIYEFRPSKCFRPQLIASGMNDPTCVNCISERKVLVCFKKGDCVHVYNMENF